MRPLRILQVIEATAGGTRRHLRDILLAFPRTEIEFRLVCATRRDPDFLADVRDYRARGIPVHVLDMRRAPNVWIDGIAIRALRRIFSKMQCDLVHLHSGKAGLLGRIAALGLPIPVMYAPHAFPFLQPGMIGRAARLAELLLAHRTTVLHAVSAAEGELAENVGLFERDRIVVLENAVDLGLADRTIRSRLRLPKDESRPPTFGFLGELREQKDPFTFVDAALQLVRTGRRARFVMPAQGALLEPVKRAVSARGIDELVDFVSGSDSLTHVYERIDFGVLPSRWEGLPYALLDAMSLRIPVIASALPVFRDILEPIEPNLLFAVGNPIILKDKMALWASTPREIVRTIGDAERRTVENSHQISRWTAQLHATYRSLARGEAPVFRHAYGHHPRHDSNPVGSAAALKCSREPPQVRRRLGGEIR